MLSALLNSKKGYIMTFMAACKNFFGFKPGQTLSEFSAEIKALTPADRAELTPGLETALNVKIDT